MTFIDHTVIQVTAGTGGSGCVSFRREKFVPKGGPDGGDGGHGGSIYVKADGSLSTLYDYSYQTHWKADRGQHGKGSNKTGRSASHVYLPVPPGTQIRDAESGDVLGEMERPGDELLVVKGGRGGRGNARFATPTHRAPRERELGQVGEDRTIELVLKLIADIGLVGEPNAGKSTLLSVVSAARPKIADYPFTTLEPHLGVVALSDNRSFVMADIPGIIEGAHQGKGLGDRFLQHIERTRVVAYLVPLDTKEPQSTYDRLRNEVRAYGHGVAAKPHIVVLTKLDLIGPDAVKPNLESADGDSVLSISAVANQGLDELKERLWRLVISSGGRPRPSDQTVSLP